MSKGMRLSTFIENSKDDTFWKPLSDNDEKLEFKQLLSNVEYTLKNGTKNEKGKALEKLMTFLYGRFVEVDVLDDLRTKDNQIDHEVIFPDFGLPSFVQNHIGSRLIGESKNHKDSVSSREVDNLYGILNTRNIRMGIISSYKPFSRGRKSVWENAEGKRRKLALFSQFDKIVIGFHYNDFEDLLNGKNFYSMIRQKYQMIIDEISDDFIEDSTKTYPKRIYDNLCYLCKIGIIPDTHLNTYKENLLKKYGSND